MLGRAWIAAALALCITDAASADPVYPVAPAARTIRLGADEVTALADSRLVMSAESGDFGMDVGGKAVEAVLARAGAPPHVIPLDVDALLVRFTDGRVVLFDTGAGAGRGGVLMQSLRLAGVSPGAITDIALTHDHFDHVGGLLDAKGALAFPNATIRLSEREWADIRADPDARALVRAIASRVRPFAADAGEILPGVTPISLSGHTPGHVGYRIASGGRSLVDIGDTAHSAIVNLARPAWRGHLDEDPTQGARTRVAELARLAAAHTLVFAPHFPFPGLGFVLPRRAGGYRFAPLP